jgi:DNA repair protein RadA/Sms
VPGLDRRLREAARLGFTRAIVPARGDGAAAGSMVEGLAVVRVASLREALETALDPASERVASTSARC